MENRLDMSEQDIEAEVQARVDFKMSEILTAVKNSAMSNWRSAAYGGNPKHSHYWEAFKELEIMLKKEVHLPCPYDQMAETKKRGQRDKAIESIMEKFTKKGSIDYHRDYNQKIKFLVPIVEGLQK